MVPDPNPVGFLRVEDTIVVDGMPVVVAAFDRGRVETPGQLRPRQDCSSNSWCRVSGKYTSFAPGMVSR